MNPITERMNKMVGDEPRQIPQQRITELLKFGSVIVSIDGNAACALLGEDLQNGEAEFEAIGDDGNEKLAKKRALDKLRARCGGQSLPFYMA